MYVAIIIAHPNPDSFCHALLKSFVDGAKVEKLKGFDLFC